MNLTSIQNAVEKNEQIQVALMEGLMEGGVAEHVIEKLIGGELEGEDVENTTLRKTTNQKGGREHCKKK